MKRTVTALSAALVALVFLAGCASAPRQEPAAPVAQAQQAAQPVQEALPASQYTNIDSKARAMGIDVPRWYSLAGDSNEKLKELYPNHKPVVVQKFGKSLDGTKLLVDGFDVSGQLAMDLSTTVSLIGGRTESGDSARVKEAAERFTAIGSSAKFSGLSKEADYWVLRKYNDGREEFLYTTLYLMPKTLFDQQIDALVNKMPAGDREIILPLVERAKKEIGIVY